MAEPDRKEGSGCDNPTTTTARRRARLGYRTTDHCPAAPSDPTRDVHRTAENAVQVVLEAVTDAIDAAERRTDREWLQQRARGAAAVLHAIASQVISS